MAFIPEERGFMGRMADRMVAVFQKPIDPKEAVRTWTNQIRAENRRTDRSIREIEMAEKKAHRQIKEYAKKGNMDAAKIVARECINSRKAINRLHLQKAHFIDMECALKEQLAMVKVAGTLSKSAEVMKVVNDAMKIPALHEVMMNMSKEMAKAGLIDEMMSDAMADAVDAEGIEEASEEEVNKILAELAGETSAQLPAANAAKVQTPAEKEAEARWMEAVAAGRDPQAVEEEHDELAQRLRALSS